MGNTDSLPVVSQVKSGVQLVCGDVDGAARTQERFLHECPVVSQVTSGVYLLAGEGQKALDTQKRCGVGLLNAADGIPVVGHAKGVIHYAVGDKEGGNKAMKSATRTTGVLAGGAGGFLLGGPVGAVAGGVYGGTVTDLSTTLVTGEASGYVAAIDNAIRNPNPGDIFDLCMMPVADGIAGHSAGAVVRRLTTPSSTPSAAAPGSSGQSFMQTQADLVKAGELRMEAQAVFEAAEANKMHVPEIQTLTEMSKAQKLWNAANKLEGKVEAATPKVAAAAQAQAPPAVIPAERAAERQKSKSRSKSGAAASAGMAAAAGMAVAAGVAAAAASGQRAAARQRSSVQEDSEEQDEEKCACTNISIPVLYVNMRSVNPDNHTAQFQTKIAALRALIAANNPTIIAIVETWLNEGHQSVRVADSLDLHGYTIWRQDRCVSRPGVRGGGILLAWQPTILPNGHILRLERNPSEDFGDNILATNIFVEINCMECNKDDGFHEEQQNKFGFTVVYRPPATADADRELGERLPMLMAAYEDYLINYDGWSIVGDFNFREGEDNPNFQDLLRWIWELGPQVFPENRMPTHRRGGCLDLVIGSEGHVESVVVSPRSISDHHALTYNLKLGKDYHDNEPCKKCVNERISKLQSLFQ